MSNSGKITLSILFLAFILTPGILHYMKKHEQMRASLYQNAKTIARLQSQHAKDLRLLSKNKILRTAINQKFCSAT